VKWQAKNYFVKCSLLGILFFISIFTSSAAGLHFEGLKYAGEVSAGETVVHQMALSLGNGESATDITVEVLGFGQAPNKQYIGLNSSEDLSPYSAHDFITLDKKTFHIEPGEKVPFTATIKLPEDSGSGGRYALLNVYTKPERGEAQVGVSTAVMVPVMLTISDTELIETGKITNLSVGDVVVGQPIIVTTTLENTGNHHYYSAWNEITVENEAGTLVANSSTKPSIYAIIPTNSVNFETKIEQALPVGTYTVHSKMRLEDGTVLDEKSTTFEVEKEYIPPFKEVSLLISAGEEAILKTDNDRCAIHFPQGAIVSRVKLTLKPGDLKRLAEAPEAYELGVTCLAIEGLQGLLAKDAQLKVQYLEEDLNIAGGNPSKLNLAYWDGGLREWVLVPTVLDEKKSTLTANTKRLGDWVIVAGAPVRASEETKASKDDSKQQIPQGWMASFIALLAAVKICLFRKQKQN